MYASVDYIKPNHKRCVFKSFPYSGSIFAVLTDKTSGRLRT